MTTAKENPRLSAQLWPCDQCPCPERVWKIHVHSWHRGQGVAQCRGRTRGREKAGCGPRRHNGKKGQGVQAEEAKIDAPQMQLLCARQSLPWADVGPCAGWTAPGGSVETLKVPGGKRNRRKGNENRREGCHVSLAFKTLPDCILKSRWTKNCRLLANARP